MPMVSSGPCWVCGSTDAKRVWRDPFDLSAHPRYGPYAHAENPDSWLVRCRVCGFAQPESLPGMEGYFDLLYSDQPWLSHEAMLEDFERGAKDYIFEEILAELGRILPPGVPRTLLDVGSYTGRFLTLAGQAGYESEGIELNARAADFAEEVTQRPIHRVKAQDLAHTGRRYGVVSMIDVLEHIPHPAPLLAQLKSLLVPGGVVVVKLPHGPMQRFKERIRALRHPGWANREARNIGVMIRYVHVNHFTVGSLARLFRNTGLNPVYVHAAPPEMMIAGRTMTDDERRRMRGRIAAYRAARLLPGGVHTPLAMQIVAYGVNPRTA
ncbi:MAG: class I SAM-dependent methyltransferase [Isosphaeraceae bacterium]